MAELDHPVTFEAQVTAKEWFLKVTASAMKYRLTYEATLATINCLNSETMDSGLPATKKGLWAALSRNDVVIKRHLYCK